MRKDKKNKIVKQKTKIGAKDKLAGLLFEQIIIALFDKYEPFREKYTFEEYCRELVKMSNDKRNNDNNLENECVDNESNAGDTDIINEENDET